MTGGGGSSGDPPPTINDGEFLLRLVQNRLQHPPPNHHNHHAPPSSHTLSLDPAVAAVGPSIPIPFPANHHHRQDPRGSSSSSSSLSPFSLSPQNPNFFFQGFPQNNPSAWPHHQSPPPHPPPRTTPFYGSPHQQHFDLFQHQRQEVPSTVLFGNIPFPNSSVNLSDSEKKLKLELELELLKQRKSVNGFDPNHRMETRVNWVQGPPPGFPGKNQRRGFSELNNNGGWEVSSSSTEQSNHNNSGFSSSYGGKDYEKERRFSSVRDNNGVALSGQIEHPGLPTGSNLRSVSALDFEESMLNLHDNGVSQDEIDDLSEQLVDSVLQDDETDDKNGSVAIKKHHRDKDFRSDARGKWILPQRMRNSKRMIECRRDIDRLNSPLLALYESLIPPEVEKAKQRQLLTLLEKLVCKEWPNARLYLYGSCANSFGVSKSDIDVCLAIDDQDVNKSEMLLKLADILQSDNLQNVQALTRARVPIVKLMDPVTGISCDICINNVLAVVNTKLLRDYAEIDVRLRQLAFLVKHWAKSRGVNETYQGTLSSYAYVLMCIHFLQQRNPPILPCLQGMKPTYAVTVDDIKCAYFDQVEKLRDFGSRNKEGIGHLLWGFFKYWAYCHDYANSVISIRTGSILSKHEKDWTRRIGNDRHLICIEDPFETSHDLGRVVDKHSIRVLREEFERAAEILQYDPNPCAVLFDRYIPPNTS